tara:strand:+ start:2178 stop:3128 length:951 start_codon:yes stop_codon:yes gene_type:complete
MRTLFFSLLIGLLAEAASLADITDIRLQEGEGEAYLLVTFDTVPMAVSISPDETGAAIMFEGVTASPFTLSPTTNGAIGTITGASIEGGFILHLSGTGRPWGRVTGAVTSQGGLVRIPYEVVASAGAASSNVPDAVMTLIPHSDSSDGPRATGVDDLDTSVDAESPLMADLAEASTPMAEAAPDGTSDDPPANQSEDISVPAAPTDLTANDETNDACAQTAAIVERDPWDLDALTAQAQCLADQGEGEAARPLLERVLAFEPSRFEAAFMLATLTEESGDTAAAMALFEQAADAARTDGQAVAARARARALAAARD